MKKKALIIGGSSGHLCHRIYDMSKLQAAGVNLPSTSLEEGMQKWLLG